MIRRKRQIAHAQRAFHLTLYLVLLSIGTKHKAINKKLTIKLNNVNGIGVFFEKFTVLGCRVVAVGLTWWPCGGCFQWLPNR